MALQETLTADLKTAMLSRDTQTVSVLRMLQSTLKYSQIEAGKALTDEEIVILIRKEVKKRNESAAAYKNAQQTERADAELAESEILKKYLPASIDPAIIRTFLESEAKAFGQLEPKHKGDLIKAAMQKFAGQTDGKTVSDIVNSLF